MSNGSINVGIVGCGNIAGIKDVPRNEGPVTTHAQAYARAGSFRVAGIVDTNPSRAAEFAARWGVADVYPSVGDMLAARRFDVLSITSPNAEHARQILEALNAEHPPRLIFSEKPICLTPDEYRELCAACDAGKTKVMVNHTRRYDPAHRRLMRFVRDGNLGRLVSGRYDYYGGWLHNGPHLVDFLYMLFDELRLSSSAVSVPGKPGDPCLDIEIEVEGGGRLALNGFDERYYQLYEGDLRFEKGRVTLRDFGSEIFVERVEVNALKERVLVPMEGMPWRGLDSPLSYAVTTIERYLNGEPAFDDCAVFLEDAGKNMHFIWDAAIKSKERK